MGKVIISLIIVFTCFSLYQAVIPSRFHLSVTLDVTWNEFCAHIEKFRTDVSTLSRIHYEDIRLLNAKHNCIKPLKNNVTILIYVDDDGKNNDTVDVTKTLDLRNVLQTQKYIGNYKILDMNTVSIDSVYMKYSGALILKVIGIVLSIYLLGYLLILSMKSLGARPDTSTRRNSIIMASENVHFSAVDGKFLKRHSVDHVFTSNRDVKQYSVKHK